MAFAAIASTQWTLGPLGEASLGNVQLHSSPGFVDIVQTRTLGIMEMIGEDLIDRYFIIALENYTAVLRRLWLSVWAGIGKIGPVYLARITCCDKSWHRNTKEG